MAPRGNALTCAGAMRSPLDMELQGTGFGVYRVGDEVIYHGQSYWIVSGPVMGTQGSLYSLSAVPPIIQGVWEHELSPAQADDIVSDGINNRN